MSTMMAEENGSEAYLTAEDRAHILSRIHSLLFWVGKFIPELEELGGEMVNLREVIYKYISKENPSEEEVQGARDLADVLERKARTMESQIKESAMTKENAYLMLDEILGLLRAVDELRNSHGDAAKYQKAALMSRVRDEKRWLQFVNELQLK